MDHAALDVRFSDTSPFHVTSDERSTLVPSSQPSASASTSASQPSTSASQPSVEERLLSCLEYEKTFTCRTGLRRHMKSHSGRFNFWCPTCGKGFHQTAHLDDHMAAHRGEKNYVCQFCDKPYSTRGNLRVHVKKAHPGHHWNTESATRLSLDRRYCFPTLDFFFELRFCLPFFDTPFPVLSPHESKARIWSSLVHELFYWGWGSWGTVFLVI